ncbi:MAG: hypothetical protein FWE13_00355 [Firmicutes bacterium]|nr:hypothetical protein [Bacillota bacterium]
MSENNHIKAGRICGNPLTGLCERIVIEVQRVFDGATTRYRSKTFIVNLDIADTLPEPFTFISSESTGAPKFENVITTRLDNCRTRIQGELIIPIIIRFRDGEGILHSSNSEAIIPRDIILNTPASALVPYCITNAVKLACELGTFISRTQVNMVACVIILTKIICPTDIVVPTYGRSVYPETHEGADTICDRILGIDIFPPIE